MDYDMIQMLPSDDPTYREYIAFKKQFGQDGSVMVIGIESDKILQLEAFNKYYDFTKTIENLDGVDTLLSLTNAFNIKKDTVTGKLTLQEVIKEKPSTQHELDSLMAELFRLKFFDGLLYKKSDTAFFTMIAVTLDKKILNTKKRLQFVKEVHNISESFSADTGIDMHYSGMPYIRSKTMAKVSNELAIFIFLAALILAIILFLFFRSFRVVLISILIVSIAVIWVLGTLSLLEFKITILTAIIPPLIIVIGIPNCIFLLNKYHYEYKRHGNKIKALSRVVQKVGNATLLTNVTTASGFATFIVVRSSVLSEFGIVASLNILGVYLLSLLLITIIFSYLNSPKTRHTKHLERTFFRRIVSRFIRIAIDYRNYVYIITAVILVLSVIGIQRIKTTGNVVDDIPHRDPLYQDLLFFEHHMTGVLPFEIKIDTREKNGVFSHNARTLYRINRLYRILETDTNFSNYLSKPLSIVDGICFLNQAHNNGNEKFYILPSAKDLAELKQYIDPEQSDDDNTFNAFLDTSRRVTRISLQMANIGTNKIKRLKDSLHPVLEEVFNPPRWYNSFFEEDEPLSTLYQELDMNGNTEIINVNDSSMEEFTAEEWENFSAEEKEAIVASYRLPDQYDVAPTGMAVVFLKGTNFLIRNLFISLGLAVLLIALFMAWMFRNIRMVIISLIPNLLPLLVTAAVMGFTGIPIKPSTILVFSIAFGISVDDTIHFLAKYRQELRLHSGNKRKSVIMAMRETGFSMIYTSIVLFFGFSIFIASGFGGTQALGILVSLTLLVAMLTNLLLLPSLILTLERLIHTKEIKKARIQIYDDNETYEDREIDAEFKKFLRKNLKQLNRKKPKKRKNR